MPASGNIVIGANASLHVAPLGTALPTDIDDTLNAAFVDVGYTSEDGMSFEDSRDVNKIRAHQSFYSVRTSVTARDFMVNVQLMEWSKTTVPLAFGGGTITTTTNGFQYVPPSPETVDNRAFVMKWADGDNNWALVVPRGFVEGSVEANLTRTEETALPLSINAEDPGSGADVWYFLTDMASMDPA